MARHDDDDDAFGPDGLLKDGRRSRVPMLLKDGSTVELEDWQREIIYAHRVGLSDAADLHRPGPRFSTDEAALDAKQAAYLEMVRDLDYRTAPKPPAALAPRGQQPGDVCTINGAPGHLNHRLECVPDRHDAVPRTMDATESQRIKDEAYAEMVAAMDYRTASGPPAGPATAGRTNNMNDREVARVHNTGDAKLDAYLDSVEDLTTAWARGSRRR
jgi:hypothetical protein